MSGCTNLLSNLVANNTESTVRTREITIPNKPVRSLLCCIKSL